MPIKSKDHLGWSKYVKGIYYFSKSEADFKKKKYKYIYIDTYLFQQIKDNELKRLKKVLSEGTVEIMVSLSNDNPDKYIGFSCCGNMNSSVVCDLVSQAESWVEKEYVREQIETI